MEAASNKRISTYNSHEIGDTAHPHRFDIQYFKYPFVLNPEHDEFAPHFDAKYVMLHGLDVPTPQIEMRVEFAHGKSDLANFKYVPCAPATQNIARD